LKKEKTSGNDELKLSFCFLRSKKSSEEQVLTTQDKLWYKESPKAFFLLLKDNEKIYKK